MRPRCRASGVRGDEEAARRDLAVGRGDRRRDLGRAGQARALGGTRRLDEPPPDAAGASPDAAARSSRLIGAAAPEPEPSSAPVSRRIVAAGVVVVAAGGREQRERARGGEDGADQRPGGRVGRAPAHPGTGAGLPGARRAGEPTAIERVSARRSGPDGGAVQAEGLGHLGRQVVALGVAREPAGRARRRRRPAGPRPRRRPGRRSGARTWAPCGPRCRARRGTRAPGRRSHGRRRCRSSARRRASVTMRATSSGTPSSTMAKHPACGERLGVVDAARARRRARGPAP